jgi:hypothetical protein
MPPCDNLLGEEMYAKPKTTDESLARNVWCVNKCAKQTSLFCVLREKTFKTKTQIQIKTKQIKKNGNDSVTSYLQQIPHVPFFSYHVIVSFSSFYSSRFAVDYNFFNYKTHTFESINFLPILPNSVVINFMYAID